jgi:hypothetical protein
MDILWIVLGLAMRVIEGVRGLYRFFNIDVWMVESCQVTNWETSGNVMVRCWSERSEYTDGVSICTKAQAQLIYISTMTMEDYGIARLSELTEQLGSSDNTKGNTRIEETIRILSDLAASLRDGEFRSKLELTFRIRTRTATGVYITH